MALEATRLKVSVEKEAEERKKKRKRKKFLQKWLGWIPFLKL